MFACSCNNIICRRFALLYHVAFLRRRSHTVRRLAGCWRTATELDGRDQLTRRQEDERRIVQRVVSTRARSAPQEGHESRQAQQTHRRRLQRNVDEQNGNRDNGTFDNNNTIALLFPCNVCLQYCSYIS